jgi:hypothetical protein
MHAQSVLVLSKEKFSAQKNMTAEEMLIASMYINLVTKKKCLLRKIKLRRNQCNLIAIK